MVSLITAAARALAAGEPLGALKRVALRNDAPALARQGEGAAFAYAGIAPSAPHALHMPSHIFTRRGYWKESIETNTRSSQAEPNPDAAVHPLDYMVYAHLQLGQDAAAKAVVDRAGRNADSFYGGSQGYNFTAMPARYALERSAWAEAAGLRVPASAARRRPATRPCTRPCIRLRPQPRRLDAPMPTPLESPPCSGKRRPRSGQAGPPFGSNPMSHKLLFAGSLLVLAAPFAASA